MSIRIRYFASLQDRLGVSEQQLEINQPLTLLEVWQTLNPHLALPKPLLMAVNLDYADENTRVNDGDEVAFFPPVTGG